MTRPLLLAILLLPLLSWAAPLGTERTWEFMQSVGGIAVGKPVLRDKAWQLPLLCDVSGLYTFTVKPTMMNSGLVLADLETDVISREIFVTVETGLVGMAGTSTACGTANLGSAKSGKYRVMYRNPDGKNYLIGEVEIGL